MTRVLLISGSLREGSTNTAALRTARAAAPSGTTAELYSGMGSLPHFNPDEDREGDPVHPAVAELRAAVAAADALLIGKHSLQGQRIVEMLLNPTVF